GRGWPPPHEGLSALVDLGMSDEQLAFYFCVEPQRVKRYRKRFGIGFSRDAQLRSEFDGAAPLATPDCPVIQPQIRINGHVPRPRRTAGEYHV
ncbi:MAG: hypothetical protein KGQ94_14190, partial [Alphaproteobacteria bacterium]|nr:hypothetical protein [Alphaproteobacteria bacterium]